MIQKRFFTLIELLLVMALLALVGSAVAFYSLRMNAQQKFYTSASRLVQNIQAAEELMVIHAQDVGLKIVETRGGFEIELLFDEKLPAGFGQIFSKSKSLPGIERIAFMGEEGRKSPPLTLRFSAKDFSVPKGVLILSWKGEERFIDLRGYPSPVRLEHSMPKHPPQQIVYPHEVKLL